MCEHVFVAEMALEALSAAVHDLDLPVDGSAIADAFALRSQMEARLATTVAEWEASGRWAAEGAISLTEWVRIHCGLT